MVGALMILFRCSGAISGLYLALLGLMLVVGGPDGNASAESRVIGGIYTAYGGLCAFCSLARSRFLVKDRAYFWLLFGVLALPLAYLLLKEHAAVSKLPSAFLAYSSAIMVFALARFSGGYVSTNAGH